MVRACSGAAASRLQGCMPGRRQPAATRTAAAQPATADEAWGGAGRTDLSLQWQRHSSNDGRPGTEGLCFKRVAGWRVAGSAGAALEFRRFPADPEHDGMVSGASQFESRCCAVLRGNNARAAPPPANWAHAADSSWSQDAAGQCHSS